MAARLQLAVLLPNPGSGWTISTTNLLSTGAMVTLHRGTDICTLSVSKIDSANLAAAGGGEATTIRGGSGYFSQLLAGPDNGIVAGWQAQWDESGRQGAICSGDVDTSFLATLAPA
jgi:hypothetical protein